jgi:pyruvate, orthophosphate dikinase
MATWATTRAPACAFTRNPNTGENKFFGEFLINAQGEDVVAGIRTPLHVSEMPKWNKAVHKELLEIKNTLEDALQGDARHRVHD